MVTAGGEVRARAVVIATGVAYRRLGVDPIEELVGLGVHYGAAVSAAPEMEDRDVFVVGGGNSAGQAALHLARYARSVTLLVRRPDVSATMSDYLIREMKYVPQIRIRECAEVVDGGGEGRLEWIGIRDLNTGEVTRHEAGGLFLLLGAEPKCDWLPKEVCLDEHGFVLTGRDVPKDLWSDGLPPANLATVVPGIFAAGDIRSGSMKRVAAASGEGASVVPLVHAHLAAATAAVARPEHGTKARHHACGDGPSSRGRAWVRPCRRPRAPRPASGSVSVGLGLALGLGGLDVGGLGLHDLGLAGLVGRLHLGGGVLVAGSSTSAAGAAAPARRPSWRASLLRRRRRVGLGHQLDHRHRGVVALAGADLGDPGVAAGTLREGRRDLGEQRVHDRLVADGLEDLTTVVQVALLGLGDQLLRDRTQHARLGLGGGDPAVLEQRRGEVRRGSAAGGPGYRRGGHPSWE